MVKLDLPYQTCSLSYGFCW